MIKAHDTGKPPFPIKVSPQMYELCNLHSWFAFPSESMTTHLKRAKILDRVHLEATSHQSSLDAVVSGAAAKLLHRLAITRARAIVIELGVISEQ